MPFICTCTVSYQPDPDYTAVDASDLASINVLCFSTFQCCNTNNTEDRERESNWSVGGTQLANSSVVPSNNETTSHLASNFTTREEHSTPPLLSTGNPSSSQDPAAVDLPCVQRSLKKIGISEKASSLMLKAWRKGTQKQYKTYLKQWQLYCDTARCDPLSAPLHVGINFLAELADNIGYSAVNTARSALSTVITLPNGSSFGKHPMVKRLLKGILVKCGI